MTEFVDVCGAIRFWIGFVRVDLFAAVGEEGRGIGVSASLMAAGCRFTRAASVLSVRMGATSTGSPPGHTR
jgi:hypothetical protein